MNQILLALDVKPVLSDPSSYIFELRQKPMPADLGVLEDSERGFARSARSESGRRSPLTSPRD